MSVKFYMKPVGAIGTNCYIVFDSNSDICAVIDPGAQGDKLAAALTEHGLKPAYILLTHGHYDHIGGVNQLRKAFPEAKLAIGKKDAEQLQDLEKSLAASHGFPGRGYIMEADELLSDGDQIEVGPLTFTVIDTPGHTLGCVTYRCGDLLFTGDALFRGSVGRTDLYGGSYSVLMDSVRKLADLEGNFHVLPGHGLDTMLEEERLHNPYLRKKSDDALY